MKKIVVALMCIFTVFAFTACSAKQSDPIEKFTDDKSNVRTVESMYLSEFKELCEMSLDDEKDVFIKVYNIDGMNYINVHVLTESNEYVIYSVDSQMAGPLGEALKAGKAPAGFKNDLKSYLQEAQPRVNKEDQIIYFDD